MEKDENLKGIFPVLPTPFNLDGSVSFKDLEKLFYFVQRAGANGFTYPGAASEVKALTREERMEATEMLGNLAEGSNLHFIMGASSPSLGECIELCNDGNRQGARYFMITASSEKGDQGVGELLEFFSSVARNIDGEIVLQNAPPPSGSGLSVEAVAEIANKIDKVKYVKEETLPCGQRISGLYKLLGADKKVFGGAGARYLIDELNRGAVGSLPAAEIADIHAMIYNAYIRGEIDEARKLYDLSLPLLVFQQVFRMSATKEALVQRGILSNNLVRENGPKIDDIDRAELKILLNPLKEYFVP